MRKASFRYFKLIAIVRGFVLGTAVTAQEPGYIPKDGFIPDAKTAIAIAEAILTPIYGQKQIASEMPFRAVLNEKGTWVVKGTLPKGFDGGVAEIRLAKQDGRVLNVVHGK
jgi:hypothetical protein